MTGWATAGTPQMRVPVEQARGSKWSRSRAHCVSPGLGRPTRSRGQPTCLPATDPTTARRQEVSKHRLRCVPRYFTCTSFRPVGAKEGNSVMIHSFAVGSKLQPSCRAAAALRHGRQVARGATTDLLALRGGHNATPNDVVVRGDCGRRDALVGNGRARRRHAAEASMNCAHFRSRTASIYHAYLSSK